MTEKKIVRYYYKGEVTRESANGHQTRHGTYNRDGDGASKTRVECMNEARTNGWQPVFMDVRP